MRTLKRLAVPALALAFSLPAFAAEESESVVKQEDGSWLVGGKHVVKGEGSKDNPYVVTWSLLASAFEDYQPNEGKTELPGWKNFLNEKYVKLVGFIALPTVADEVDELMLMRNEWDGCCLGIPPTPYDSIEVTLRNPTNMGWRANYGAIQGKLNIDPYLHKNWLISLYAMEDANLVDSD